MTDPYEIKRLLPLVAAEVVTLPPIAAKVADLKWLTAITIVTPSPQVEGRFMIEYRPMTQTGEILYLDAAGKDTTRTITVPNLYALKSTVIELDAAFSAVLACVNPVEAAMTPPVTI